MRSELVKLEFQHKQPHHSEEALSVTQAYHRPDGIEVTLGDVNLVANTGLLLVSFLFGSTDQLGIGMRRIQTKIGAPWR